MKYSQPHSTPSPPLLCFLLLAPLFPLFPSSSSSSSSSSYPRPSSLSLLFSLVRNFLNLLPRLSTLPKLPLPCLIPSTCPRPHTIQIRIQTRDLEILTVFQVGLSASKWRRVTFSSASSLQPSPKPSSLSSSRPMSSSVYLNTLASRLERGTRSTPRDAMAAGRVYEVSAGLDGNLAALCGRGRLLWQAGGDLKTAKVWLQAAARKGCVECLWRLGCLWRDGGVGVETNPVEGLRCFEAVLKAGGPRKNEALFEVAWMISGNVTGVHLQFGRAARLYEELLEEERNLSALLNWGNMVLDGYEGELERDVIKAKRLFETAAREFGNVEAMNDLGLIYCDSIAGVAVGEEERDFEKGTKWLEMAVEGGYEMARFNLAKCLAMENEKKDVQRAIVLYEDYAEQFQHICSLVSLGDLYAYSCGHMEMGVRCWERAVAIGVGFDEKEMEYLGIVVEKEEKLREDDENIREMRQKSIGRGCDLVAMLNVAEYLIGMDVMRTLRLLNRAVQGGIGGKEKKLESILREVKRRYGASMVIGILERIVEIGGGWGGRGGIGWAMCWLGDLLMDGGEGIGRDEWRGKWMYERAMEQGSLEGMLKVGEAFWRNGQVGRALDVFSMLVGRTGGEGRVAEGAVVAMAMIWEEQCQKRKNNIIA